MRGAIPPLPQYSFIAWCSVKKQHRDNFAFSLTLKYMLLVDIVEFIYFFNVATKFQ
jgi:hypothetical protein